MPKLKKETKEQIKKLQLTELQEIVLKFASMDKKFYDYLLVNYLEKENGEIDLFELTKIDLDILFTKRYKGNSIQLQMANVLSACVKEINAFTKISKNKFYETELLLYILDHTFEPTLFGTCFSQYDNKVAIILRRIINIVTKNLHEDYKVQYEKRLNEFLKCIHQHANHIDAVYKLPQKI